MNIDLDVLGFIDDNATVCTIVNGKLQSKKKPPLPQRLGEHRLLQEPPVHHLGGGRGPGVHPLRRKGPPLPVHLLRAGV